MELKDLTVHVTDGKACAARVQAATRLAVRNDAHLTGLYIFRELHIPTYAEAQIGTELVQAQLEAAEARALTAERAFLKATEQIEARREWRCVKGDPVATINLNARYSDLLILGQPHDEDLEWIAPATADRVTLESGRPVLLIPYIGAPDIVGKRILIAWNASREAVRAVSDALGFLKQAKHVTLLAVNPKGSSKGASEIPFADICRHLARHGVEAEAHTTAASDIEAGALILSRAADMGADLIVMGAYGHSRFRELVLGGATRHILAHMTVPVFMSH